VQSFGETKRSRRRFFSRLDDDAAPGRDRGGDLSSRGYAGEIPWRESRNRADRFFDHELAKSGLARRHNAPISPAALFCAPFENLGAGCDFDPGFLDRFAFLDRELCSDVFDPFTDKGCSFAKHVAPFYWRGFPPNPKCVISSVKRLIEVFLGRVRQFGELFPGGRVDDMLAFAPGGIQPLSVNPKIKWPILRVHIAPQFLGGDRCGDRRVLGGGRPYRADYRRNGAASFGLACD